MTQLVEEKITALSTFFLSKDISTGINAVVMSSKGAKKPTTKSTNLYSKPAVKKDVPKKAVSKKKHVVTSSDDSSSSSDSSEDEPPKKSKKKNVGKKKHVVTSSDESSSSEEDDDEIVVEKILKHDVPADGLTKLGEGLVAIAEQLAASNAANSKILDVLLEVLKKMEVRDRKNESDDDLIAAIDGVVARGEIVTIGNVTDNATVHHFGSVGHLRADSGKLAMQSHFAKLVDVLDDEHDEEIAATGA